jgi:hypothetical protein
MIASPPLIAERICFNNPPLPSESSARKADRHYHSWNDDECGSQNRQKPTRRMNARLQNRIGGIVRRIEHLHLLADRITAFVLHRVRLVGRENSHHANPIAREGLSIKRIVVGYASRVSRRSAVIAGIARLPFNLDAAYDAIDRRPRRRLRGLIQHVATVDQNACAHGRDQQREKGQYYRCCRGRQVSHFISSTTILSFVYTSMPAAISSDLRTISTAERSL